jgi:hypothetical protein
VFFDRWSLILKKPLQRSESLRAEKSLVLRFKPRSFFTEQYSINAGEASIVLLDGVSRTKKKFVFHRSVSRTEIEPSLGRIFSSDESAPADRKNGIPCKP